MPAGSPRPLSCRGLSGRHVLGCNVDGRRSSHACAAYRHCKGGMRYLEYACERLAYSQYKSTPQYKIHEDTSSMNRTVIQDEPDQGSGTRHALQDRLNCPPSRTSLTGTKWGVGLEKSIPQAMPMHGKQETSPLLTSNLTLVDNSDLSWT
ncbi:hypothetical protein K431DRAFT_10505 [Polychaeton citri CBS 116435]|uniref:Uncharacterized protein n=1 Tax=Polychaeton citri CBS 116435 TaxID=1314669 RepID=A0A9P4UTC2_9PEZI|nr:hypothetical protein K431DRAFT_10505 [Polychaeton citri CBS 116435]